MPQKINYDYYMKKPEIRKKWEENDKEGFMINPITGNELTSKAEGSVYYLLKKAYNKYKDSIDKRTSPRQTATSPRQTATSPRQTATSPRQTATSPRKQYRKLPGILLNKNQEEIKQYLNDRLNSFTLESTYEELKKILEDLIDLKEFYGDFKNIGKYNPPYYGKNGIQSWMEKMREQEYQKRYVFYDLVSKKDYVIYNNYNLYFKTIMYAFIYGLFDSDEIQIPESLSQNSINGYIPSKFVELLKLVFQKYNFEEPSEKEIKEIGELIHYHARNDLIYKLSAIGIFLEEFKYLKFNKSQVPISSKEIAVYKENITKYHYKEIKTNEIEIEFYLKNALLKYNKKFQLSDYGKEFKALFEKIKSLPPPALYNPYNNW